MVFEMLAGLFEPAPISVLYKARSIFGRDNTVALATHLQTWYVTKQAAFFALAAVFLASAISLLANPEGGSSWKSVLLAVAFLIFWNRAVGVPRAFYSDLDLVLVRS